MPNAANVKVYEIGDRIVPDSSAMQSQGGSAQLGSLHAGNPEIQGHCFHMQAVPGDAGGMVAKELIAPGCAVTTYDVNFGARMPDRGSEVGK